MTSHENNTKRERFIADYKETEKQIEELQQKLKAQAQILLSEICKFKVGEDVLWLTPEYMNRKTPARVRIQDRSISREKYEPMYKIQKKAKYGYNSVVGWFEESRFQRIEK